MTSKIDDLSVEAEALLALCRKKGLHIATAESCTGGLIAAILTEIAGSSDVFDRGFVTYSNEAKADMLGVSPDLILKVGAVSEQVAEAMATGALARSLADLAISVTGVAGPGGGSPQKPVGMVCISLARRGQSPHVMTCQFGDVGRATVRFATVKKAFALLQEEAEKH